jgi:hypothetical protein
MQPRSHYEGPWSLLDIRWMLRFSVPRERKWNIGRCILYLGRKVPRFVSRLARGLLLWEEDWNYDYNSKFNLCSKHVIHSSYLQRYSASYCSDSAPAEKGQACTKSACAYAYMYTQRSLASSQRLHAIYYSALITYLDLSVVRNKRADSATKMAFNGSLYPLSSME